MIYPVYLLLGPEDGLKQEFINSLTKNLGNFTTSKFYAFDDYEDEMFSTLTTVDMFFEKKLVILDEAQEIKLKNKQKNLAAYIKNPSPDSVLLILSRELYISSDIMNSFSDQKHQVQKFYELFENKKTEWIKKFFQKNKFNITLSACDTIIERIDNNIQEFTSVCNQIITYIIIKGYGANYEITAEDVDDFLVYTRQESFFTLFSYIVSNQLENSISCLQNLLRFGENITLVPSRLSQYFRRAHSVSRQIDSGLSLEKALSIPFFLSEKPIVIPKDKNIYREAVNNYTLFQIRRILALLAEYDVKVKEAGLYLQQYVLEKCIFDIVVNKGKYLPVFEFTSLKT